MFLASPSCRRAGLLLGLSLASAGPAWAGSATIRSTTDGERIFVDGSDTGLKTPAVVRGLSAGRHLFEARGNCTIGRADVLIPVTAKVVVNITSAPVPGTLQIKPTPANATVRVDNQPFDGIDAPVSMPCGAHSVTVEADGHMQAFLNIKVGADQRVVLPVDLQPLGLGRLELRVQPSDASLVLDGKPIAAGTSEVAAGVHVLRASAEGYEPLERQFLLDDGESLDLDLTLTAAAVAAIPPPPVTDAPPPKAKEPKAKEPKAPKVKEPKAPRERTARAGNGWWSTTHTVGVGATTAGVVLGALAIRELGTMVQMGQEYNDRVDTINQARDYDQYPPSYANGYRTNQLLPQRNRAVGLTAASAAVLGAGLTLTLAF